MTCYNRARRSSNVASAMNGLGFHDLALRALVVVAGTLAAVLLFLKGQAQALPALAVGATLGAFVMGRFGPSEE
jgi:hypothetical protein